MGESAGDRLPLCRVRAADAMASSALTELKAQYLDECSKSDCEPAVPLIEALDDALERG